MIGRSWWIAGTACNEHGDSEETHEPGAMLDSSSACGALVKSMSPGEAGQAFAPADETDVLKRIETNVLKALEATGA